MFDDSFDWSLLKISIFPLTFFFVEKSTKLFFIPFNKFWILLFFSRFSFLKNSKFLELFFPKLIKGVSIICWPFSISFCWFILTSIFLPFNIEKRLSFWKIKSLLFISRFFNFLFFWRKYNSFSLFLSILGKSLSSIIYFWSNRYIISLIKLKLALIISSILLLILSFNSNNFLLYYLLYIILLYWI